MDLILLILVVFLVLGALPGVGPEGRPLLPHEYGYYPSALGVVLLIVLIILLFGGGLRLR